MRVVDNREQRCSIYPVDVLRERLKRGSDLLPVPVVLLHDVVGAIANGVKNGNGANGAVLRLVKLAVTLGLNGLFLIEGVSDVAYSVLVLRVELQPILEQRSPVVPSVHVVLRDKRELVCGVLTATPL